jgi:hypothetical protein
MTVTISRVIARRNTAYIVTEAGIATEAGETQSKRGKVKRVKGKKGKRGQEKREVENNGFPFPSSLFRSSVSALPLWLSRFR